MDTPHHFCRLEQREGRATLFLAGDWRLPQLAEIDAALGGASLPRSPLIVDGAGLAALDTAAALALLRRIATAGAALERLVNFTPSHARVVEAVRGRLPDTAVETRRIHHSPLAMIGMRVIAFRGLMEGHLGFFGRSAAALGDLAVRPRGLRVKE